MPVHTFPEPPYDTPEPPNGRPAVEQVCSHQGGTGHVSAPPLDPWQHASRLRHTDRRDRRAGFAGTLRKAVNRQDTAERCAAAQSRTDVPLLAP